MHYWNSVLCQLPKAVGKDPKTCGKGFADCFTRGSRQRTRGKEFVAKEPFATCQEKSSRQSLYHLPIWQSAKGTNAVVRWRSASPLPTAKSSRQRLFLFFYNRISLPTAFFWRVAKGSLPTAFFGRWQRALCRLPFFGTWQSWNK